MNRDLSLLLGVATGLVGFVIIFILMLTGLSILRQNQIESCNRVNILREEFNNRAQENQNHISILNDLIILEAENNGNDYDRLLRRLRKISYDTIDLVNCEKVITLLP